MKMSLSKMISWQGDSEDSRGNRMSMETFIMASVVREQFDLYIDACQDTDIINKIPEAKAFGEALIKFRDEYIEADKQYMLPVEIESIYVIAIIFKMKHLLHYEEIELYRSRYLEHASEIPHFPRKDEMPELISKIREIHVEYTTLMSIFDSNTKSLLEFHIKKNQTKEELDNIMSKRQRMYSKLENINKNNVHIINMFMKIQNDILEIKNKKSQELYAQYNITRKRLINFRPSRKNPQLNALKMVNNNPFDKIIFDMQSISGLLNDEEKHEFETILDDISKYESNIQFEVENYFNHSEKEQYNKYKHDITDIHDKLKGLNDTYKITQERHELLNQQYKNMINTISNMWTKFTNMGTSFGNNTVHLNNIFAESIPSISPILIKSSDDNSSSDESSDDD